MDILNQFHANDAMRALSQYLLIPTVLCLLLLALYAVYTLGSLVVEAAVERRRCRVLLPQLVADLDTARYDGLSEVIARSGLLDTHNKALQELISYIYLPEDALTEIAKRLLADENARYQKALSLTDSAVKIAPMLGLMGTLIPLGPGIVALSSGDLKTS